MTTLPVQISKDQVLELLARAVIEKGADYVYQQPEDRVNDGTFPSTCYNFSAAGEPSCIVGHVISYLGVTNADVTGADCHMSAGVSDLRANGVIDVSDEAYALLAYAQGAQDIRNTWGHALAYAIECTARDKREAQDWESSAA